MEINKGLSDEIIKFSNNSLAPAVKFSGEKQNIYIVYDLKSNLTNFDSTLQNCLLGAIKLTKNSDIDKYEYAGYGIKCKCSSFCR